VVRRSPPMLTAWQKQGVDHGYKQDKVFRFRSSPRIAAGVTWASRH
jgi:hypothetical protein